MESNKIYVGTTMKKELIAGFGVLYFMYILFVSLNIESTIFDSKKTIVQEIDDPKTLLLGFDVLVKHVEDKDFKVNHNGTYEGGRILFLERTTDSVALEKVIKKNVTLISMFFTKDQVKTFSVSCHPHVKQFPDNKAGHIVLYAFNGREQDWNLPFNNNFQVPDGSDHGKLTVFVKSSS